MNFETIQWTAFDWLTGQIIMDSNQIGWDSSNPLMASIGQAESVNLTFNVTDASPSEWVRATTPGLSGWVAWLGDPTAPMIIWGGIVTQRVRTLSTQVQLQLTTPECWLDACPMGQWLAGEMNQDDLLAGVVQTYANGNATTLTEAAAVGATQIFIAQTNPDYSVVWGSGALIIDAGTPLAEIVETIGTGQNVTLLALSTPLKYTHAPGATVSNLMPTWVLNNVNRSTASQSLSYSSQPNVTVLGAMQAISSVLGGPQWLTGWQWNTEAGTIVPTLTYGQRIGAQPPAGAAPAVTISLADLQGDSAFTEDYSAGYGANRVVALGSASSKSSSNGAVANAVADATPAQFAGRPVWAYTYTPNAQTSDEATLADYAANALLVLAAGNQPIAATLQLNQPGKRYGTDWVLGDTIGWEFGGTQTTPPHLVTTNLATQPIPTANDISVMGAGYNSHYYSDYTLSLIPAGQDGPVVNGTALGYRRKTLTSTTQNAAGIWLFTNHNPDTLPAPNSPAFPVTPGHTYRISYWFRVTQAQACWTALGVDSGWCDASYNNLGNGTVEPASVPVASGVWTRYSGLLIPPSSNATGLALRTNRYTSSLSPTVGDTSDITGLIITDVTDDPSLDPDYFDGTDPNCVWTGTPNNSASQQLTAPVTTTPDPQFPTTVTGTGQVIGVKITPSTVTPVLSGAVLS